MDCETIVNELIIFFIIYLSGPFNLPIMVSAAPVWIPFLVPLESTKKVAKRHNGMPIPVERVDIRSIFSPNKIQ